MSIFQKPDPAAFEPQISRVQGLSVGAAINIPEPAGKRLIELMAYRWVSTGRHRQALEEARSGLEFFRRKILDTYHVSWEAVRDREGFKDSQSCIALTGELAGLTRNLAAAQRAEAIYTSDTPISRGSLQVLSDLAAEATRFINRSGGNLKAVEAPKLERGETAEKLQAALQEADSRIEAVEKAWPTFEAAWASVTRQLDDLAKLPSVAIHERLDPPNAPRALPTQMTVSLVIPEIESLHAVKPGSQLLLIQPNALGMLIALMRPQVEELLRKRLEALYAKAKADGTVILPAREQKQALKDARASRLLVERRLAEGFWAGKFPATVLSYETDPRALLGLE